MTPPREKRPTAGSKLRCSVPNLVISVEEDGSVFLDRPGKPLHMNEMVDVLAPVAVRAGCDKSNRKVDGIYKAAMAAGGGEGRLMVLPRSSLDFWVASKSRESRGSVRRRPSLVTYWSLSLVRE